MNVIVLLSNVLVHGDIRHLEKLIANQASKDGVHGDIRHLENALTSLIK